MKNVEIVNYGRRVSQMVKKMISKPNKSNEDDQSVLTLKMIENII